MLKSHWHHAFYGAKFSHSDFDMYMVRGLFATVLFSFKNTGSYISYTATDINVCQTFADLKMFSSFKLTFVKLQFIAAKRTDQAVIVEMIGLVRKVNLIQKLFAANTSALLPELYTTS